MHPPDVDGPFRTITNAALPSAIFDETDKICPPDGLWCVFGPEELCPSFIFTYIASLAF